MKRQLMFQAAMHGHWTHLKFSGLLRLCLLQPNTVFVIERFVEIAIGGVQWNCVGMLRESQSQSNFCQGLNCPV